MASDRIYDLDRVVLTSVDEESGLRSLEFHFSNGQIVRRNAGPGTKIVVNCRASIDAPTVSEQAEHNPDRAGEAPDGV